MLPVMEWMSHGDERYSTGNTVTGMVLACMVTEGSHPCGEQSTTSRLVQLLCCTPEMNVTLCVDYTSTKKKKSLNITSNASIWTLSLLKLCSLSYQRKHVRAHGSRRQIQKITFSTVLRMISQPARWAWGRPFQRENRPGCLLSFQPRRTAVILRTDPVIRRKTNQRRMLTPGV